MQHSPPQLAGTRQVGESDSGSLHRTGSHSCKSERETSHSRAGPKSVSMKIVSDLTDVIKLQRREEPDRRGVRLVAMSTLRRLGSGWSITRCDTPPEHMSRPQPPTRNSLAPLCVRPRRRPLIGWLPSCCALSVDTQADRLRAPGRFEPGAECAFWCFRKTGWRRRRRSVSLKFRHPVLLFSV